MRVYNIDSSLMLVYASVNVDTFYTFTWGFHRCSFRQTGQCESLDTWNEQQIGFHVFFVHVAIHYFLSPLGAVGIILLQYDK